MASRSALRVFGTPLLAVLGSQALAAEVCHPGSGECDELGLLQQTRWPKLPLTGASGSGGNSGECSPPCQNGGRCIARANYCHCNPGFTGEDCSEPDDACFTKKRNHSQNGVMKCGLGFTVYPYIQPQLWGTAYEGWETCAGKQQSPVNIVCMKAKTKKGEMLQTDYGRSAEGEDFVMNNGHSLEVDSNFGTLTLGSLNYEVQNIHFHSPSEHTVDWKHATMEMHIVHKSAIGSIAVVGIFFDIGAPNTCLEKVFSSPAPMAGCESPAGSIDLSCFDEQLHGSYWSYAGSLTTPPCTEGLSWQVMKKRATISREQLEVFKTRYVFNARPTQPLNGRRITYNRVA